MQKRILFMSGVIVLIIFALGVRIGYIQFIDGKRLSGEALEQQTRDRMINAKRGTIYDRNGKQLAVSANVETVSISPVTVRAENKVLEYANKLSEILKIDAQVIMNKINTNTSYIVLKKKVEKEEADKIREAKIPNGVDKDGNPKYIPLNGVYLDADTKRYYPYNNIASHIIGFTGVDNQGLLGIELQYDSTLKGEFGRIITARNADGTEMPYKYDRYYTPQDGNDITLTIDVTIQHFLEKHLEQALTDNQLQAGAAGIIMDIRSGEILGMATKPDFNLNEPLVISDALLKQKIDAILDAKAKEDATNQYLNKVWRNKAVVDSYEPGSTFKIITASMALEEGTSTINDTYTCTGSHKVGGHTIRCWKGAGHGTQTFVQAMMNSCNPAFMMIGERIGTNNFYKYYTGFGFTEKTGIELSGETRGIFHNMNAFNEVELATSSFGQSFQITPLQMISAVGAVANDGKLLKPHILKNITDQSGNIIKSFDTVEVRQVITPQTSQIVRGILETVVSEGTGKKAYLEGFRIGGKTGTSEKLPRGNGKYIASFVGMAPANDPKVAIILLLDEPLGDHMGGTIASPLAGKILDDVLRYMNIEPELPPEKMAEGDSVVPDVLGKGVNEARKIISEQFLRCVVEGNGDKVTTQVPNSGVTIAKNGTVIVYTGDAKPSNSVKMPNVVGKTYEEVKAILEKSKLLFEPKGIQNTTQGAKASTQSVAPDEYTTMGTKIIVEFTY
jgi:stage V sporulation protein D (sporulation-specific penicillin-binding protein)